MLIKNNQCQENTFNDLKQEIDTDIDNLAALDNEIIRRNNTILIIAMNDLN